MSNEIFSLINNFGDVVKSVNKGKQMVVFQNKKKELFTLIFKINENNLNVEYGKKDNNSVHLAGLIQSKKFNNVNLILDLLNFIKEEIDNITNYCVGCYEKMDHQSDRYISCGNDECVYKFEELRFGNPVLEKFKKDPEIFKFLIKSSFDAITCPRKFDIFEPFPTKFLTGKADIKRGEVSKLAGKNFDSYKDFNKLDKIIKDFNIDTFTEEVDMCVTDDDIIRGFGEDVYTLIRFIILSCKVDIIPENSIENIPIGCKIYRIVHPMDKDKEFEELKKKNKETHYLFHGSKWHNWYSILRNGLKNCSKTKLMTAGAAYGDGIYLSNDTNLSYGYGLSGTKSIMGVFEILGHKDTYKKGPTVFVVPDDKVLIQKYFIIMESSKIDTIISRINSIFNIEIYQEKEKTKTKIATKGIKKLIKEYKVIAKTQKTEPGSLGFRVEVDTNNAYLWKVYLNKYDEKYPVGQDMKKLGIKEIEMEIRFPETYPFSPPFIRVIKPRFQRLTGHITSFGALCMEVLTPKGWSPACSMESLLVLIKSEILEGDARIDTVKHNMAYSLKEAESSFIAVARSHNWL